MKTKLFTALLTCLALQACDSETSTAPTAGPDNTGTLTPITSNVNIRGVIASKAGLPIPGLTVKSKRTGLSTKTDANGVYRLTASSARVAARAAGADTGVSAIDASQGVVDSVIVVSDSNSVTKMALKTMVDSLPALFLIQRNFSGKLSGNIPASAKVVLSISNVGSPETKTLNLWFNTQAQSYSGFVYFVFDNQQHSWSSDVKVYDSTGTVTAWVPAVVFNTSAGDIQFPDMAWRMFDVTISRFLPTNSLDVSTGFTVPGAYDIALFPSVSITYKNGWFNASNDTLRVNLGPAHWDLIACRKFEINCLDSMIIDYPDSLKTHEVKVINNQLQLDSAFFQWAATMTVLRDQASNKFRGLEMFSVRQLIRLRTVSASSSQFGAVSMPAATYAADSIIVSPAKWAYSASMQPYAKW